MLQINQVKVPIPKKGEKQPDLKEIAGKFLRLSPEKIKEVNIRKQSLDARKKPKLFWSFSLLVTLTDAKLEEKILRSKKNNGISLWEPEIYKFPEVISENRSKKHRPVIIGTGPAGLFCGYMLSLHGFCPILLERGLPVQERKQKVLKFWKTGELDINSNIQFGEGGAGTFSDGKLQTQVKDKYGRIRKILEIFVEHGAPEEILYLNKPHIGTDILEEIILQMRQHMIELGAEFHFETCFLRPKIQNNQLTGIIVKDKNGTEKLLPVTGAVLAIGHSARDTFLSLYKENIPMENKPFAVGFRMQHPQDVINQSQYGEDYRNYNLPAADYKLTYQASSGRGVYSFCMCPGGYVVNASSEEEHLAINGMSYHARDSHKANSAIVITVGEKDYGKEPLAGLNFQRDIEHKAYMAGNQKIPVESYGNFKREVQDGEGFTQENIGNITEIKGLYQEASVKDILPEALERDMVEAIEYFGHIIQGFSQEHALLLAVESRTSSPVKILRDDNLESSVKGLFPCGEGAGYAGGITSAAMDGLKVAEKIALLYNNP